MSAEAAPAETGRAGAPAEPGTSPASPVRLAAQTWESLFRAQVAVMRRLQAGPAFKSLALNEYDVLFTNRLTIGLSLVALARCASSVETSPSPATRRTVS